MANNLDKMNDEVAASLILKAIAKRKGVSDTTKKTFGGSKQLYDIIVNPINNWRLDSKYVAYTFYAVKTGKAKSAPRALGELVLKDVVTKLLDHVKGESSGIYSLAGDLSGGLESAQGGWMDTKEIYSTASKIGGQMQLHAAKKMGSETYDQVRIFGLSSHVAYGGVVRFEEVSNSSSCKGLNVILSYWIGLSGAASWIDDFQGKGSHDRTDNLNKLDKMGGDFHSDYIYSPGNGLMW